MLKQAQEQGFRYIVAFRGTDGPNDVEDYPELLSGDYIHHYDPLLSALSEAAPSGATFAFTGASLGGGATNLMANIAGSAFGGRFAAATFVGFASPIISTAAGILNIGFENDPIYRAINFYEDFSSSLDNLVLATSSYMAGNYDGLQTFPPDFSAHTAALGVDAWSRVAQSAFYDFMMPDSVLIFDANAGFVQDVMPGRENTGAFYLGENVADIIAGRNGNDFLEGFGGDDFLLGGAGNDFLVGGTGNDTFNGGADGDRLVGDIGIDTAVFSSSLAGSTVARTGVLTTVGGPDGVDFLASDELLQFSDLTLHNLFFTGDFDNDGRSDIALQNGSSSALWLMNGTAIGAGSGNVGGTLGAGWFALGAGDFNGNGTDDLLLQNGQQLAVWQMNGTSIGAGSGNIGGVLGAGWMVAGTGDFNGDLRDDILLQNGQQLVVWQMNGTSIGAGSGNIGGVLGAGWMVAGTGDFNGDLRDDILLQNGQQLAVWQMNGTAIVGGGNIGALGASWMVAGVADVNDDNRADILLQNGQQVAVWEMNGTSIIGGGNIGTLGAGWAVAGNGDFNGDGNADLLLQNGQQIAEWLLIGTAVIDGSGGVGTLGPGWDLL